MRPIILNFQVDRMFARSIKVAARTGWFPRLRVAGAGAGPSATGICWFWIVATVSCAAMSAARTA